MPQVIVYAQPNCPNCLAEKRFLRQQGIVEKDVSTNAAAAEQLRCNNVRTTPATKINGEFLAGFRPNRLIEMIRRQQN